MNAKPSARPITRRRRILRCLLVVLGLGIAVVGVAAYNLVTLRREATMLRDELRAVLGSSVQTRLQVSAGPLLLGTVRTGLNMFIDVPIEAQLALDSVRKASVGLYTLGQTTSALERTRMFHEADAVMSHRGWTRVVGVTDRDRVVLIYVPEGEQRGTMCRICIAVCEGEHPVLVSGSVRVTPLVELALQQQRLARR